MGLPEVAVGREGSEEEVGAGRGAPGSPEDDVVDAVAVHVGHVQTDASAGGRGVAFDADAGGVEGVGAGEGARQHVGTAVVGLRVGSGDHQIDVPVPVEVAGGEVVAGREGILV